MNEELHAPVNDKSANTNYDAADEEIEPDLKLAELALLLVVLQLPDVIQSLAEVHACKTPESYVSLRYGPFQGVLDFSVTTDV